MDNKPFDRYEQEVEDIDEIEGTDVKINPEYYIHNALTKAQEALSSNDNIKERYSKYRILVEHIESLCEAANLKPDDFDVKMKNFTDELKETDEHIKIAKTSNYKLKLLLKNVFSKKVTSNTLRL